MANVLSGATPNTGRTYGFNLDFVTKSQTSTSTTSSSSTLTSSPSSTISKSSNIISRKKPRTFRKRPNQRYNEAAILLSTAYPNLFSTKNLKNSTTSHFTEPINQSSEQQLLLFPLIKNYHNPSLFILHHNPTLSSLRVINSDDFGAEEDFDCESILHEGIKEGIDSILGNSVVDSNDTQVLSSRKDGAMKQVRALRHGGDGGWWSSPAVDVIEISSANEKNEEEKDDVEVKNPGLMLKLNYDVVRDAWSDRGSPFAGGLPGND